MQATQVKKSPITGGKKIINSTVMQREKPFNNSQTGQPQQQALSYQISKQYHQQNRIQSANTLPQRRQSNSRNNNNHQQQSIEESQYFQTKTISINLNQLAHSSSQASLKSYTQHALRGQKNDLEQAAENAKKLKTSFRENSSANTNKAKIQTARSRKSPSPQKIMYNLEAHQQYQSMVNEKLGNTRNQISRSKKSIDAQISNSRLSARFTSAKKDSINNIPPQAPVQQQQQQQQASFRTTVSAVTQATNLKSRTQHSNLTAPAKVVTHILRPSTASSQTYSAQQQQQQQLQQIQLQHQQSLQQAQQMPSSFAQTQAQQQFQTLNSFDNINQSKSKGNLNSTQYTQSSMVQTTEKKTSRMRKKPSDMASPSSLMHQRSPRLTMGAGQTTGATSIYSVTSESIINQSGNNNQNLISATGHIPINSRKLCLSEKLQPKGKKKKANAHKQIPKQITITKDQIILQPFLSIYQSSNTNVQQISGLPSGVQSNNFNTQQDRNETQPNRGTIGSIHHPRTDFSIQSSVHGHLLSNQNQDSAPQTQKNQYSNFNANFAGMSEFMSTSQKNQSERGIYFLENQRDRESSHMFSFHQLNNETANGQGIASDLLSEYNTVGMAQKMQNQQSQGMITMNQKYEQRARDVLSESVKGRTSSMFEEEQKEITGIFGGHMLDQNVDYGNVKEAHVRRSSCGGTAIDNTRKTSSKVATPVFLQKSQDNIRKSDVSGPQVEVQNCDETAQEQAAKSASPEQYQNSRRQNYSGDKNSQIEILKNANASFLSDPVVSNSNDKNQMNFQIQTNTKQQQHSEKKNYPQSMPMDQKREQELSQTQHIFDQESEAAQTQSNHQQSMKKVYSTSNLEISRGNISVAQTSVLHRQDSQGSFFSRIKNYFGAKPQSQIIDLRNPDVEYRCKCGQSGRTYACKRAMKWLSFAQNYSELEYEKNRQLYLGLIKFNTASGSESQIERDIPRTFPNSDPFMCTPEGQKKLSNVLNAFSKYFTSIGYVQGMNFIVGALLMHCSEDIAFWLFVSLIEDYEMRDIYQPKLPGLYKHSQVLQLLQMEHLQNLYYHFSNQNILIEMYASDWIFALFSNIIPISEYHHFLDNFFVSGWTFFYKFSLTFLKCHSAELQRMNDLSEILNMIKLKSVKKDSQISDFKSPRIRFDESGQISELESLKRYSDTSSISPSRQQNGSVTRQGGGGLFSRMFGREQPINSESFKDDAVWERIINLSSKEWEREFNEHFVNQLLASFDPQKLVFNSSFPSTPKDVSVAYSPQKPAPLRAEIIVPMDTSPHNDRRSFDRRPPLDTSRKMAANNNSRRDQQKLQIILNDGIRNPRQQNMGMIEPNVISSSKVNTQQKGQSRGSQQRDMRKSLQPQHQSKRFAP